MNGDKRSLLETSAAAGMALLLLPVAAMPREPDPDIVEEINELCAGCLGEYGQGGKQGEYPRLAGQPYRFLYDQLDLFRERKRPNLAMVEYVDERQMPDDDIQDISAYLAGVELPSRLPPIGETAPDFDALARLEQARRALQIPRADGDVAIGGKLYRRECAPCHGSDGGGDSGDAVRLLSGQYTAYLWRQVDKYVSGVRIHDPPAPEDRLLADYTRQQLGDILVYVSTLDD